MNITRKDTCFPQLTVEEAAQFQRNQTKYLFRSYRLYFAWIPLPLIVIALILTSAFMIACYEAMKHRRVSRKCYIFVLNRAIGDILCCIFFLLCALYLFVISTDSFNVNIFIVLTTLCGGCLWTAMVSYVCLSFIKLYAVYKPLNYKTTFNLKLCLRLIIFSWIMYALMILYTWIVIATSSLRKLFNLPNISASRSVYIMSRSKDVFFVVVYLITIVVFLLTVIFIRRGQKFVDTLQIGGRKNSTKKRRFPLWKLSLNVLIFALVNFAYVYAAFVAVFFQDSCYWRRDRYRRTVTIGLLRCVLLARIIVDSIIGFVIDVQVRRAALNIFGRCFNLSSTTNKFTSSVASADSSMSANERRSTSRAAYIQSISLSVSSNGL